MPIKAEYDDEKKKVKHFTGGKPKSFELTTEGGSRVVGRLSTTGKAFVINVDSSFCPKGLREVASHFAELADIMDGKAA